MQKNTRLTIKNKKRNQSGFTLIELLVATAIGAMIMVTVSSMFFIITLNSAKIGARKEVKNVGENIKQHLDYIIKNSLDLLPNDQGQVCGETTTSLSTLKLRNIDNSITDIGLIHETEGNFIVATNSANGGETIRLNPKEVNAENLGFSCIENPAGETYINYQFNLKIGNLANQHFSGFVLLRNNY